MNILKVQLMLLATLVMGLIGCTEASRVSNNLSKAAEEFEIDRRIVFYNGITDKYMLVIEGRCSVNVVNKQLSVTCKTNAGTYRKHYLGLSDNVTYISEQIADASISSSQYRVIFKPSALIPNIEIK